MPAQKLCVRVEAIVKFKCTWIQAEESWLNRSESCQWSGLSSPLCIEAGVTLVRVKITMQTKECKSKLLRSPHGAALVTSEWCYVNGLPRLGAPHFLTAWNLVTMPEYISVYNPMKRNIQSQMSCVKPCSLKIKCWFSALLLGQINLEILRELYFMMLGKRMKKTYIISFVDGVQVRQLVWRLRF